MPPKLKGTTPPPQQNLDSLKSQKSQSPTKLLPQLFLLQNQLNLGMKQ